MNIYRDTAYYIHCSANSE